MNAKLICQTIGVALIRLVKNEPNLKKWAVSILVGVSRKMGPTVVVYCITRIFLYFSTIFGK
jgi:hypothetical protein